MAKIKLSNGKFAIVSNIDFSRLIKFNWSPISRNRYVGRTLQRGIAYMHRDILGLKAGDGKEVDHINGNGFDNRRENLRVCSRSKNLCNRQKYTKQSKYKGVYPSQNGTWSTKITINKKSFYIGTFKTPEGAKAAYEKFKLKKTGD